MKKTKKKTGSKKKTFIELLADVPIFPYTHKHYWADYVELKCLVNKDYQFSQAEFQDIYKGSKDLRAEHDDEFLGSDVVNENDSIETFVQDCFELIKYRENIFKGYYPFTLSTDKKVLIRPKRVNIKHKLYLFFLFCSTLRYTSSFTADLTNSFEMLGKEVFKNLLPLGAKVHMFGSGNPLEVQKRYTGNLWKKIQLLADDFYEIPKAKESDFPSRDIGDNGLDIVAWVPNASNDKQPFLLSLFGQSACTPEWESKQFSSNDTAWRNTISFSVPPTSVILCPYSLRKANGEWHQMHKIGGNLMLDRQRLIFHFRDNFKEFKKWPSFNAVDNLIKMVEPIF